MQLDGRSVDQIYEAAAIPELWPKVLDKLCVIAEAPMAALLTFDERGNYRFTSTPNFQKYLETFAERASDYKHRRPERALATGHPGFLHDLELFTQDELDSDLIYRDFVYPSGLKWTAGAVIPTPTADILVFDLSRRQADGPFTRETMLRLDAYRPHLARAALLAHRLGLRAARTSTEAMQTIGLAAAVLTADGRAISTNAALEALVPRIQCGAFGRLRFLAPGAARLFDEALAKLGQTASTVTHSIPLPAEGETPALIVHVIPIRRAAEDIFGRAAALLVVTPVTAPRAPMTEVLTGLFDLTPAEVKIARGIATGASIDDLAAAHAISREAVRTQLKSVMQKTGTTRQAELVLLLSGTSPFCGLS